eukprot:COSAG02_NODE_100_length_36897_cov_9.681749_47_plen_584_part_00
MADVLWRKVQEGPRPAWNYLGRVARKGSANAHHCSIMLRVCDSAEDLQRLEDYIAEQAVGVDDVLLRQLHQAWLDAGRAGSAVRSLMTFATNRAEMAGVTDAALQHLLRCDDTEGATDYLAGLVEAAAAQPHHLWQVLHAFGPDRVAKRHYLLDNNHKLNLTPRSDSTVGDDGNHDSAITIDLDWASSWLAALHSAFVSADAALQGTELLSDAVEIGLLSAESARQQSIRHIRKLQRRAADGSRSMATATYLAALHQSGLLTAEHFATALTSAQTLAEGRELLDQLQSLPIMPDRNVAAAFHELLVHEQSEMVDFLVLTPGSSTIGCTSKQTVDVVAEAALWVSSCVQNGYIELDAAATVLARSLSLGQQNLLSERENAWRYFDTLVASNAELADNLMVLSVMARDHCVSQCDVEVLATRVSAVSTSTASAGKQRLSNMGSACNRYADKELRSHKVVGPSQHAVLHDAWLGIGPSGVGRAVDALSDAIHTGSCTQEEAGRIATTTLGRCRGGNKNNNNNNNNNNHKNHNRNRNRNRNHKSSSSSSSKAHGMLEIVREDYFAKLQQVRKIRCLRTVERAIWNSL